MARSSSGSGSGTTTLGVITFTGAVFTSCPMGSLIHLFPEGAKKLTNERTENPSDPEASFLNYADRHLDEAFKSEVMRLFPDAAPWEVNGGRF